VKAEGQRIGDRDDLHHPAVEQALHPLPHAASTVRRLARAA